jgi:ketosteroid isomerase-like protein
MVMFDLRPPLQCRGLEAYERTWDLLFRYHKPGTAFDFRELAITAGADVAFAVAIMWCGPGSSSNPMDKDGFLFRLTVGLCKVDGDWRIAHEHHSVPAMDWAHRREPYTMPVHRASGTRSHSGASEAETPSRGTISRRGNFAMIVILKLASLLLVVATVIPSVAHALELPGKLRLTREQYFAVQPIYYPGFTAIGAAEPLSVLVLAALLALTSSGTRVFWLIAGAMLASILTHALYWALTAPENKVWLRDEALSNSAQRLFESARSLNESDWTIFRDRWERSHLYRAAASVVGFILLAVALLI